MEKPKLKKPRLLEGVKDFSTLDMFRHGSHPRSVDEFITLSKMRYGDRFTYERVVYVYSRTPVEITCKKHGPFSIAPDMLLKGGDCPRCRKEAFYPSYVRENFIAKAEELYGEGKYDYSLVYYKSIYDPITIICPEHGPFFTTPRKHMTLNHCPQCMKCKPWNNGRFLKEAVKVHGGRYDYSKVGDISSATQKITIICPKHGEFTQLLANHIHSGTGCPACGNILKGKASTVPFSEFVRDARKIHGNKYQYNEATYTTMSNPTVILCPIHGEFTQRAEKHSRSGRGCPKCGIESRRQKRTKPYKVFLAQVRAIYRKKYGKKYQFDKTTYVNTKHKVRGICPEHGEFWKSPNELLSGQACPRCSKYQLVTRERFFREVQEVHGDKYDYSRISNITGNSQRVTIICPEHGEFTQKVQDHLHGRGCHKCIMERARQKQKETLKKRTKPWKVFIAELRAIYGKKYQFDETTYVNTKHKVRGICPEHGEFWKLPYYLLNGRACPKCGCSPTRHT